MTIYSFLLGLALLVSAPWWLWRMAASARYRAGLAGRLGAVPAKLCAQAQGRRVVWIHAVSVGEVLATERLVGDLRAALGDAWLIVLSTTTSAGYEVAERKLGVPVFYFPLDFAFAVRRYLRALRPALFCTIESELWPRMLVECERMAIPVAVVNARVSDRSFPRYMRLKRWWRPLLGKVRLFLAQSDESAQRLLAMGVPPGRVRAVGNLKYDAPPPAESRIARWIKQLAAGRPVIVAGSTLGPRSAREVNEEQMVIQAWERLPPRADRPLLVLAPRHPQRFDEVASVAMKFRLVRASHAAAVEPDPAAPPEIVLLDTIGDLAAVYQVASLAFIGGSLVPKGGHNPLEAARFGVPVIMGPSYENFREIVDGMRAADAIRIVNAPGLSEAFAALLAHDQGTRQAMEQRGRAFYEAQAGATQRTLAALLELVR